MVTVAALLKAQGNVRHALGLPDGTVKCSDRQEWCRLEVLKGLIFSEFHFSEVDIGVDFVRCDFKNCDFLRIHVEDHFWGVRDTWKLCWFKDCHMSGMIAPMNTFRSCRFDNLELQDFKPYQTLFIESTFTNCSIHGLKAQAVRNNEMINPDMARSRGQVVFRGCKFEAVKFRQCYFQEVIFEGCTFSETEAYDSSFDGIISDEKWWKTQKADPFTVFLGDALDLIRRECGPESAAYREFERYCIDHGTGITTSRDFTTCLYNSCVPYAETQKIIKDLRKLVRLLPI